MKTVLKLLMLIVIAATIVLSCEHVNSPTKGGGGGNTSGENTGGGENTGSGGGEEVGGGGEEGGGSEEVGGGEEGGGGEEEIIDPPEPLNFIITFIDDDTISVLADAQTVSEGSLINEPEKPARIYSITEPGLYRGVPSPYTFDGWYNGDTRWDFDTDTASADLTLTAKWIEPDYPPVRITAVNPNDIPGAFTQINAVDASVYTLLISANTTIAPHTLSKNGVSLNIIGSGTERRITLSSTGTLFTVNGTGTGLSIGENITLAGIASNNNSLIKVQNGSFTMLDGSKITENTSNAITDGSGRGAAVYVAGATSVFIMKGGSIRGNTSSTTGTKTAGGVFVDNNGTFFMEGGSIEGNTAMSDVLIDNDAVSGLALSGNARIGQLALNANSNAAITPPPCVSIASGWTGKVYNLNLRGESGVMDTVSGFWYPSNTATPRRTILKAADGYTLSAADVKKFPLGNFLSTSETERREISSRFMIDNSCEDIGKLVQKP